MRKPSILLTHKRIEAEQSLYFDMWRGGSAIVVLLGHIVPLYFHGERIFAALAGGAVAAFFGLSGFFIHKSLTKGSETGRFDWLSFAAGRFDRIVPPFVLALAVTILCWLIAPWVFASGSRAYLHPSVRDSISLDGLWETAALLNGFVAPTVSANGALWSLSFEVWLYVCAGFLVAFLTGRKMAIAGLAIFPLLAFLNPLFGLWSAIWLAGAAVSICHANGRLGLFRPRILRLTALLPLAALALVVAIPRRYSYGATLIFEFAFGAWFIVHMGRALLSRKLPRWRALERAAGYSYTLYVIHFPLLLLAYGTWESPWGAPFAGLAILALAGAIGPRIEAVKPLRFLRSSAARVSIVRS
ncbi:MULTISPECIES: acyltransferase family protein [unclassified Sphingomonas]|uniref:acyltransferase family protein n=1 Tax=unclassified Sphingomonas TaxID=196159 RepID=UPI0006FE387A|nr:MULTISPECIES: acyltransferase family protein [unclassified Sphingomonas]KQX19274.1 hypothetical protein ASD17_12055 [Sphingomonas sp. Root1294]KQY65478.1 hypothetical protein ASD39_15255 [Sphingomonas sp. Root50]KRB95224.1 hypothetical protein ASE22_04805 [Sphingomonas sp. Root720]